MTEVRRIYDAHGGVVSEIFFRGADETWHTRQTSHNIDKLLRYNKARITDGSDGYSPSRDLRHVARIDPVVYVQWQKEFMRVEGLSYFGNRDRTRWKTFLRMKLNDSDNRFMRTVEGKL